MTRVRRVTGPRASPAVGRRQRRRRLGSARERLVAPRWSAAVVLGVALVLVIALRTPWDVAARAARRPHPDRPDRRAVRRRSWTAPSPSPRPSGPASLVSLVLGLAVAARPRPHPARRAARAGRRPHRSAAAGSGRSCSGVLALTVIGRLVTLPLAAYGGGGPAPLRAVHPQLGAVAPGRRRLHRHRRRPDGPRAARPGLARPPGAAHVVGLGGAGAAAAGGRRLVPVAGGDRARVQHASSRCRPGSCAPTCSSWRSENGTPVRGRAGLRRLPADDGAQRLRLRVRLDPADRRLRHRARPAARRPRSSRSSPTSSGTSPTTTSSPARSSARSAPAAGVARARAGCCPRPRAAPPGGRRVARRPAGRARWCCSSSRSAPWCPRRCRTSCPGTSRPAPTCTPST